jgi:hypothetical protein
MTNAFNWRQYTTEERAARGENPDAINASRRRSQSAAKAVDRLRVNNPTYGTVGVFAVGNSSKKEIR